MFPSLRHTLCGIAAALATAAQAHVTLESPKAAAGSTYKAVLKVGHGCEGSPTHTVTVQIPSGLSGAKPVPKAGWTLSLRKEKLGTPYESHGRQVTEDVVEVSWKANTRADWLEDAWYDEFTVRGQLPPTAGPLWFKVSQVCEKGRWDWAEVPKEGMSTQGLRAPAALLEVQATSHTGHAH